MTTTRDQTMFNHLTKFNHLIKHHQVTRFHSQQEMTQVTFNLHQRHHRSMNDYDTGVTRVHEINEQRRRLLTVMKIAARGRSRT